MMRLVILSILLGVNGISGAAKWPSKFPKCHYGDGPCLVKAINAVVKSSGQGIPELNLLPTHPVHVDLMDIIQSDNRPVKLNSYFRNLDIYGLDAEVYRVTGFNRDLKFAKTFARVDKLQMLADYEMKGQMLILPIEGRGRSNITLTDIEVVAYMSMKLEKRKNREVLQVTKLEYDVTPANVQLQFTNLFNGQKELSDTMHRFMNENWREIYGELKGPINNALAQVIQVTTNNVLAKFDYRDLFLED